MAALHRNRAWYTACVETVPAPVMMDEMSERRSGRGHETLPHTADVGLRGWGPTMVIAFEESAIALAELTSETVAASGKVKAMSERIERVELVAADLVGLAYAWLNELVGLIDLHGALRGGRVSAVVRSDDGWILRGSAGFVPFDGVAVRRRADVKSATYHGLAVDGANGAWTVTAYLDV